MPPRRSGTSSKRKSCHERALGLLSARPRSRRELETRLLRAGFERAEVLDVLDRLQGVGLVDDEAFARQLAERQFEGRLVGRRAVAGALRAKGISPGTVSDVLEGTELDEEERAFALARSRAGRLRGVEPLKAFARLSSLLARRGYGPELSRRAARQALELDDQAG